MRIAICDDVDGDRRAIAETLSDYLKNRGVSAAVEKFSTPLALLEAANRSPFDVYLLDVLLSDDFTGIELVQRLRTRQERVSVVFFSTCREYAVEAFSLEAVSYLQKPWTKELFFRALDRAMETLQRVQEDLLTFRSGDGVVRFAASQIESVSTATTVNYVLVSRAGGGPVTLRGSVKSFAEEYGERVCLIPAGRSILINPAQISALEGDRVRFFSDRTVDVPHSALTTLSRAVLELSCP